MKAKTIVPLVIGLGVGFFAIKMGIDMVNKAKGAQGNEKLVYVTSQAIEVATKITEPMLTTTHIAASLVPPNAFTDKKSLVGRVSAMTIAAGVPITNAMLAPPGAEPGLHAIIPSGHRAVSVSVNEESSVAGFIMPGAHVDVSAVSDKTQSSRLILTDVEVGAVGQSLSEVGQDGQTTRITKSVTLFLEPHEVQILNAHTGGRNKVRLALRGVQSDPAESMLAKWLKNSLAKQSEPVKPKPRKKIKKKPVVIPPRQYVVDVVRGKEMERLIFQQHGDRFQSRVVNPETPETTPDNVQPQTNP